MHALYSQNGRPYVYRRNIVHFLFHACFRTHSFRENSNVLSANGRPHMSHSIKATIRFISIVLPLSDWYALCAYKTDISQSPNDRSAQPLSDKVTVRLEAFVHAGLVF
jgi:hypothetical protein